MDRYYITTIIVPMARTRSVLKLVAAATLLSGTLVSCSNHWTEEQQKSLMALDQQRDGLRTDLDRSKSQLMDARSKLAAQDKNLSDCSAETAAARSALEKWPNIWADSADWRVAPPPPPPAETTTGKKKHK